MPPFYPYNTCKFFLLHCLHQLIWISYDYEFICVAPCVRIEATGSRSATAQLRNLTQRSPLSEVAPFCDRPAFVDRRFFRHRGSCPLYRAPSRAQTCRIRSFASSAIYPRVFRTPYCSPADGNDTNDSVSRCRAKTTTVPFSVPPKREGLLIMLVSLAENS